VLAMKVGCRVNKWLYFNINLREKGNESYQVTKGENKWRQNRSKWVWEQNHGYGSSPVADLADLSSLKSIKDQLGENPSPRTTQLWSEDLSKKVIGGGVLGSLVSIGIYVNLCNSIKFGLSPHA